MAQAPGGSASPAIRRRPQNDMFTVLLVISAVFLAGAVSFLAYRLMAFYGTVFPPAGG